MVLLILPNQVISRADREDPIFCKIPGMVILSVRATNLDLPDVIHIYLIELLLKLSFAPTISVVIKQLTHLGHRHNVLPAQGALSPGSWDPVAIPDIHLVAATNAPYHAQTQRLP